MNLVGFIVKKLHCLRDQIYNLWCIKRDLKATVQDVWTGLMWLKIGTRDRLL